MPLKEPSVISVSELCVISEQGINDVEGNAEVIPGWLGDKRKTMIQNWLFRDYDVCESWISNDNSTVIVIWCRYSEVQFDAWNTRQFWLMDNPGLMERKHLSGPTNEKNNIIEMGRPILIT